MDRQTDRQTDTLSQPGEERPRSLLGNPYLIRIRVGVWRENRDQKKSL